MKIVIKARWSDTILFEGEFESTRHAVEKALKDGANLDGANLTRANLYGANLTRANLYGANLDGANLYGANLYGANLDGANLDGANLYGAKVQDEVLKIAPIQVGGLRWIVFITPEYMRIGCQRHTHAQWAAFKRTEITPMADKAWDWWKEHGEMLLLMCKAHAKTSATAKKAV